MKGPQCTRRGVMYFGGNVREILPNDALALTLRSKLQKHTHLLAWRLKAKRAAFSGSAGGL